MTTRSYYLQVNAKYSIFYRKDKNISQIKKSIALRKSSSGNQKHSNRKNSMYSTQARKITDNLVGDEGEHSV